MVLPSKKILSVFILTTALVVTIIVVFGRDKSSEVIDFTNNLVSGEKISIPENPGWQDELGKIHLINVGTDEIKNYSSSPKTTTDIVTESLMSNYLALKRSGKLDSESVKKLLDQTLDLTNKLEGESVLDTNLNIVPDNGKQSIIDYGENLGNIIKNNRPVKIKNELEIISSSLNSNDPLKIKELDSVIVIYEKIANELTKMTVPKTFVEAHLDMVNSVKTIIMALRGAEIVFSDPVKGLMAIQSYKNGATTLIRVVRAVGVFINQNDIIYKQGSGGYYLLHGI